MGLLKDDSNHTVNKWVRNEQKKRNDAMMGRDFTSVQNQVSKSKDIRKAVNRPVCENSAKANIERINGFAKWVKSEVNKNANMD